MPSSQVTPPAADSEVPSPHAPETADAEIVPPAVDINSIKAQVTDRLAKNVEELDFHRERRDYHAAKVRALVAEQADLTRVANSFKPRRGKAKS